MNNLIEEICKEKGIMKSWIADQVGVHKNTITSLVKGAEPHLGLADKIAKVLGKTIYEVWPDLISKPKESE